MIRSRLRCLVLVGGNLIEQLGHQVPVLDDKIKAAWRLHCTLLPLFCRREL